ncbi:hypothetical protein [Undibacterium flavidum]|uniref:DoxX-like protein n=1 Tax=Undibacterium flavidum TaxID=2762297 RepID=A0ABR6YHA9_9BURK|nr:hypothetical protein [Undibacterium flavidum]MBC3875969.1 hypothetical protein [Undibacterium flavidum]
MKIQPITESRYRKLLWTYIALTLATIVSSLFPIYSENLETAYNAEPETWFISHYWIAVPGATIFALTWVAGLIGLFFFKNWARALSTYTTLMGFFIYTLIGTSLHSGLESAFIEASATLWGIILALSYFSPISEKFER